MKEIVVKKMNTEPIGKNIGLYFYRGYYENYFGENGLKKLSDKDKQAKKTKEKNDLFKELEYKDLILSGVSISPQESYNYLQSKKVESNKESALTLAYPGLTSGVGYTFGAGVRGELQMGFMFDYTTGLPYLPGASVKGAMRSIFPKRQDKKEARRNYIWDEYLSGKLKSKENKYFTENLKNKLSNINNQNKENITKEEEKNIKKEKENIIEEIELEIFEGRNIGNKKDEYYSVYQRDIFHDAYIAAPVQVKGGAKTNGKFIGLDYITPHKDNPLKNPFPLPFLKILPGVTIQFDFDLKDGYYLKKEGKEALFRQILLDFGIGAKTNVGYGQFEANPKNPPKDK